MVTKRIINFWQLWPIFVANIVLITFRRFKKICSDWWKYKFQTSFILKPQAVGWDSGELSGLHLLFFYLSIDHENEPSLLITSSEKGFWNFSKIHFSRTTYYFGLKRWLSLSTYSSDKKLRKLLFLFVGCHLKQSVKIFYIDSLGLKIESSFLKTLPFPSINHNSYDFITSWNKINLFNVFWKSFILSCYWFLDRFGLL